MSELDAQALYIHRKHVGLAHIYGEAPAAVEAARLYFLRQLESVTAVLRTSPGLLGTHFTAADLLLTHVLLWAKIIGWLPAEPTLAEYVARHTARPAFKRVYAEALAVEEQDY